MTPGETPSGTNMLLVTKENDKRYTQSKAKAYLAKAKGSTPGNDTAGEVQIDTATTRPPLCGFMPDGYIVDEDLLLNSESETEQAPIELEIA